MLKKFFRPLVLYLSITIIMCSLSVLIPEKAEKFLHILLVFYAWTLSVFIHELGHVLFGITNKMKLVEFTVAIFTCSYTNGKYRLGENKEWSKLGGIVRFLPFRGTINESSHKWKMVSIGGPLFSLFFGSVFLIISWVYPMFFITIFGYMNLGIFLFTIIPLPNKGYKTDGAIYLTLSKSGLESDIYMCSLLLLEESTTPAPPSEWPIELINKAEEILNRSNIEFHPNIEIRTILYYYYLDIGDHKNAIKMLAPLFTNKIPLMEKKSFRVDAISSLYVTHQSLWGGGGEDLHTIINERISFKQTYSFYRAHAAYLINIGEYKLAEDSLKKAESIYFKKFSEYGLSKIELNFLKELKHTSGKVSEKIIT